MRLQKIGVLVILLGLVILAPPNWLPLLIFGWAVTGGILWISSKYGSDR